MQVWYTILCRLVTPPISTICTGMAASITAVLYAQVKNKRSALKHSRVMIHQPLGGVQIRASDIEITAKEIQKLKRNCMILLLITQVKVLNRLPRF